MNGLAAEQSNPRQSTCMNTIASVEAASLGVRYPAPKRFLFTFLARSVLYDAQFSQLNRDLE
ncbi:MAG: hypothetical protein DME21_06680 [Verrucomicrobia bacterium]|nr:MAG: hypothetical protein DME21_06680 [Verrucomicrobiota bacterium]